ncbi:serine hydrolase [Citricoccus sp. K5]|uniref:serine hydrolase n=1 Tax=Citricoccus sp. K5 TaxID=2653135 RepID=UPI0012F1EB26|nr:serine hydrolase [Citricoccus sp. K5]VXC12306.1 Beta-lactamase family protein [Citricoccus sp. K5]
MSRVPAVRALRLGDIPAAYPQLRFAVRFSDGRESSHDAGARHPLAGTGMLVLAAAVARLAESDPGLLGERLTLTADHRRASRTGTLRRMDSELQLTVDDALSLLVGTGDGACLQAVLEFLAGRGVDLLDVARTVVTDGNLADTEVTGFEPEAGVTTPADLCTALSRLPEPVLGWMGQVFEPAGLASALPGFGPRTVPHHTVAGWEPAGALSGEPTGDLSQTGFASVLVLPGAAVVAAYLPALHQDGTAVTPLEVSTDFGTLGLSVWRAWTGPGHPPSTPLAPPPSTPHST